MWPSQASATILFFVPSELNLPSASRSRVEILRYTDGKELADIIEAFKPSTTDHIATLVIDLAALGNPSEERKFGLRDGPYGDAIAACSAKMLSTLNVNVL